eukprot:m.537277 g.537277  ORF g.537277 m.537277 type:complete len:97 (-) comp22075_c0_seq3:2024-2314(-)
MLAAVCQGLQMFWAALDTPSTYEPHGEQFISSMNTRIPGATVGSIYEQSRLANIQAAGRRVAPVCETTVFEFRKLLQRIVINAAVVAVASVVGCCS